jgi:hypothetical protein
MSTVKAVNFQHPSSSTPAITLDSTGAMTGSFPYPNRNLIYNGAMQVHQRSVSVTGINSGAPYHTADRWCTVLNNAGTWTQTVENDAPTGSGLRKSLKMLCTTAANPAPSDAYGLIIQKLEGQDLQRLAKGTASAQQITISFWVKSNVIGTYVVGMEDTDNSRMIAGTYTILSSGTWEKKSLTFTGDISGVLDNDNVNSLQVLFWLIAGSQRNSGTLVTSWAPTVLANSAVGQTNVATAISNYWQVTGVQLEVGSVATPFEFKSYGQELRECQRYFISLPFSNFSGNYSNNTAGFLTCKLPVTMRSSPNAGGTAFGTAKTLGRPWIGDFTATIAADTMAPNSVGIAFSSASSSSTVGTPVIGNAADVVQVNAEL